MPAAAIPKPDQDSSDETDDAMLTPREIVEHLDKNIVGQVQDTSPPIWDLNACSFIADLASDSLEAVHGSSQHTGIYSPNCRRWNGGF